MDVKDQYKIQERFGSSRSQSFFSAPISHELLRHSAVFFSYSTESRMLAGPPSWVSYHSV